MVSTAVYSLRSLGSLALEPTGRATVRPRVTYNVLYVCVRAYGILRVAAMDGYTDLDLSKTPNVTLTLVVLRT